jgi:hypothetical protein
MEDMAEKSSVVDEALDGVRTLFGRLGEFFHIFDLSFLVAGATTFGALAVLYMRLGFTGTFPFSDWVAGFALIIACYVCGLISFSLGRLLNGMLFRRRVLGYLKKALAGQRLRGELIEQFAKAEMPDFPPWRLYIRLWQQLAEKHPHSIAFTHLSRYWAMAATYDGVAVSLLVWAAALLPVQVLGARLLSPRMAVAVIAALVVASVLCLRQGGKYYEFQVEDLVAALAVMKSSID